MKPFEISWLKRQQRLVEQKQQTRFHLRVIRSRDADSMALGADEQAAHEAVAEVLANYPGYAITPIPAKPGGLVTSWLLTKGDESVLVELVRS